MFCQSSPVVLSMTEKPCRVAVWLACEADGCGFAYGRCGGGIGEEDAVGGLPDRDLGEEGDAKIARSGASVGERQVAKAFVAIAVQEFEVGIEVGAQGCVEEANDSSGGELEGSGGAGVGEDGEEATIEEGSAGIRTDRRQADFEREDAAGEGGSGSGDLNAGTAQGAEEILLCGLLAEGEGKGAKLLVERCGGVIAGAGDAAAAEVDGGEGLKDVVELGGGEVEGDGLVAGDMAGVLEEADAVLVEGDVGDRQARRVGGCGRRRGTGAARSWCASGCGGLGRGLGGHLGNCG